MLILAENAKLGVAFEISGTQDHWFLPLQEKRLTWLVSICREKGEFVWKEFLWGRLPQWNLIWHSFLPAGMWCFLILWGSQWPPGLRGISWGTRPAGLLSVSFPVWLSWTFPNSTAAETLLFSPRERQRTFAAEVLSDGSEWIMFLSSSWNSLQSSWEMSRRLPSWMRNLTVPLVGNDCLCSHYDGQFQDKYFCFRKVLIILLQNLII